MADKLEVSITDEVPFCFVCDHPPCGAFFNLLECVTEYSQSKMSIKLADLVGKEFLVVIEETDIICRSCCNILNTMDRLESQLANLGNTILNFLEEKYSLSPGEIFQTAPPLQVLFKKDISETGNNEQDSKPKRSEETEELDCKEDEELFCKECSYSTSFKALMVFHLRQHIKLNIPPEPEEKHIDDEAMNNHPEEAAIHQVPSKKPVRGGKRLKPGGKSVRKKMRTLKDVEEILPKASSTPLPVQVEAAFTTEDGMNSGGDFEFIASQDDDHLSEEMLSKVECLVQSAGTFQVDTMVESSEEDDNELQVFLTHQDLLEVEGEPGVFCMMDAETGKIIQRLKRVDDGSFVPLEVLQNECHTVMQQLEDGSLALVSLPGVLEHGADDLSLM